MRSPPRPARSARLRRGPRARPDPIRHGGRIRTSSSEPTILRCATHGRRAGHASIMAAETPRRSVLTIGHSRHPIDRFLALLRQHGVETLVDARSHPFSRFSPQFSRKPLERAVSDAGVRYLFLGDALGGRPAQRECYDEAGKLDYARVERLDTYQRGID